MELFLGACINMIVLNFYARFDVYRSKAFEISNFYTVNPVLEGVEMENRNAGIRNFDVTFTP